MSAGDAMATSVLFDVFALGQAVRRLLGEAMAGGPLRPEDYAVYSAIFELEAGTPTAIAARLSMPLTTVMDHLARLESRGHARRLPDPGDRRASRIVLSADGLAAHREANRAFETAYAAFVRELPRGAAAASRALGEIRSAAERAVGASVGPNRGALARSAGAPPTPPSGGRGG